MEFDLSQIKLSKNDIKRGLVLPKNPSKELAEFIGILAGDGHVSFNINQNKIHIAGNYISDYDYFYEYINKLIQNLFNINVRIIRKGNTNAMVAYFYSQGLVSYLKKMGYYKHTTNIKIPKWITGDENLMVFFY